MPQIPPANNSSCVCYSPCRLRVRSQLTNLLAVFSDARLCLPAQNFSIAVSKNTGSDIDTFFEPHCFHSHAFSHFSVIQDHSAFLVKIFRDNFPIANSLYPQFSPLFIA